MTKENAQSGTILDRSPFIENLDELRMPARRLLNLSSYTSPLAAHQRVTTMMSSRGCPGRCSFCDRPQMGKRFRKRSAEGVVREMAHCAVELGLGEIAFYDDTFTIDKSRVMEICDRNIVSGLRVHWDIRARVDTVTPEMLGALRSAGCVRIHHGVETGSARLQKVIRKNLDLEEDPGRLCADQAGRDRGAGLFHDRASLGEAREIDETLEMILSLPRTMPTSPSLPRTREPMSIARPLRAAFTKRITGGIRRDPRPGFTPRYWNEHFSDAELLALLKRAYGHVYCRPGYVLRRLLRVRSAGDLICKAPLGLKLLGEVAFSR